MTLAVNLDNAVCMSAGLKELLFYLVLSFNG